MPDSRSLRVEPKTIKLRATSFPSCFSDYLRDTIIFLVRYLCTVRNAYLFSTTNLKLVACSLGAHGAQLGSTYIKAVDSTQTLSIPKKYLPGFCNLFQKLRYLRQR